MKIQNMSTLEILKNKGVEILNPESVYIAENVDLARIIGPGVTIHSGCKILGETTLILPGAQLGYEGPVTIDNCQLGPEVQLKGGFFKEAVFLKGVTFGLGGHVREGTILEERANCAHTVGLKQTILFPFVTLGSLINFCDCLMSGGTSSVNHSEVGSSFIHFNYTPNQDKATASLIGDVPHGVMINQAPIFLGGQGGLVGPTRLAFGTVTAAGTICRRDELRSGYLMVEGSHRGGSLPYTPGGYRSIKRIVHNNLVYLSNLKALKIWYDNVRKLFISDSFPDSLWQGLRDRLDQAFKERVKRLQGFQEGMAETITLDTNDTEEHLTLKQQRQFVTNWSRLAEEIERIWMTDVDSPLKNSFLEGIVHHWGQTGDREYIPAIQSIDGPMADRGSLWLQGEVDAFIASSYNLIPLLRQ